MLPMPFRRRDGQIETVTILHLSCAAKHPFFAVTRHATVRRLKTADYSAPSLVRSLPVVRRSHVVSKMGGHFFEVIDRITQLFDIDKAGSLERLAAIAGWRASDYRWG